ncbi:MAG: class I SAM-dependent RNA methyltransferase, partial [Anaerolineaceae bacterium]|nr:class I SAM-dependent RNA methyltransferase [Anaerolineaceae bacterium]
MNFEIILEKMVFGGDCMGHLPDGRAVFVPYGLPGEKVEIQLIEDKKRFARAEIVKLIQPSELRITPQCEHFTDCGGCQYQHIKYEDQLQVKQELISNQLERIAGLKDFPVDGIQPCSQPWNYRNRAQFHIDPEGKLGFLRTSSHEVIDLKACHLLPESIDQIWRKISFDALEDIDRIELVAGSDDTVLMILDGLNEELPRVEIELPISTVHLGPKG